MDAFQEFAQAIGDTLPYLYDPAYQPPEVLFALLGQRPEDGLEGIQATVLRAIEDMKPPEAVPTYAHSRRIHEVLAYRYVQQLTQEQTAERLGITPRHLRREQQAAVNVLAKYLWRQRHPPSGPAEEIASEDREQAADAPAVGATVVEWRSQVKQELASLQRSAPDTVAEVGTTMRSIVDLLRTVTTDRGIDLALEPVEPDLVAAIHYAGLRQILLSGITRLAKRMSSGQIRLRAVRKGNRVKITVTGSPVTADSLDSDYLTHEVLAMGGGTIKPHVVGNAISFDVELPSADKITVLVVDDNTDLVHFYKRYVLKTRYRIVSTAHGQRIFETIESVAPDIIVLDVMLPDVDGWELLTQLHEYPSTKSIPVIVCSVVREEELSLALGAALYVAKPVRRRQFLRALDQALSHAATEGPTTHANNAATC